MTDLKNASLVCRRWSSLTFSGRRMDRVQLKIDFRFNDAEEYFKILQNSSRRYRVLVLLYNRHRKGLTYFFQLLRKFKKSIRTITTWNNFFITSHELRKMLVEVPKVQHLSVLAELCFDIELNNEPIKPFDRTKPIEIAPQLQTLKMDCDTDEALNVYRYFSDRLKFVAVYFKTDICHQRFCELRFPCLEQLEYWCEDIQYRREDMIESLCQFFQSLANLRQLVLGCRLPATVLQSITSTCRKIIRFSLRTDYLRRGSLASLAELTKLKCLELHDRLKPDVFEGCKEIESLESVILNTALFYDMLDFCNHLCEIATNLSSLTIRERLVNDETAYFVCSKFRKLKFLSLELCLHISERVLSKIDQLHALHELELGYLNVKDDVFDYVPRNTVRQLTIKYCDQISDESLLKIPGAFPSLQRLKIKSCRMVTKAGLAQLPARMPDIIIQVYAEDTGYTAQHKLVGSGVKRFHV
ncbi:uncharacterized protein LOC131206329 [Anopheles bellator]|uniref:uncharacterized protein LOC131206329 n=1 Tax=Anopheles bellator TaxID=139047 RepID=UPI002647DF99|nr:uncharacterized protein LOC131206329 [Anopheles bellator]